MKLCLRNLFTLVVCLLALSQLSGQETAIYKAILTGRNLDIPVLTPATGDITISVEGSQLVVSGSFMRLTGEPIQGEDAFAINLGIAGQSGDQLYGLIPTINSDGISGFIDPDLNTFILTNTASVLEQLENRLLYVDIKTEAYPEGEIRGQFGADALTSFSANLYGSNETPVVQTAGKGIILAELVSSTELVVSGSFKSLEGRVDTAILGGAHLHIGFPGKNGNVTISLNPTIDEDGKGGRFEATNNTFDIEVEQLIALGERRVYANIHTDLHPMGEIRGQLVPTEAGVVYRTNLFGTNTVPNVSTQGFGAIVAEVYSDTLLIVSGSFSDLGSPFIANAQSRPGIFTGFAGETGRFTYPLNLSILSNSSASIQAINNVYLLEGLQSDLLSGRALYINIPSLNHPTGELRGQLTPEGETFFNAFLSGTLAVPAANTFGSGNLLAELTGNQFKISGSFLNTDGTPLDSLELSVGLAGQTDSILFPIALGGQTAGTTYVNLAQNSFELSDEQVALLKARQLNVNIPTTAHSTGELRGQLLPEANAYFVATLSGASESTTVRTDGIGQVIFEVTGTSMVASGSLSNLQGTFEDVGICAGLAGLEGTLLEQLMPSIDTNVLNGATVEAVSNQILFEADSLDRFFNRGVYVNVFSDAHPMGEIRGQILPFATAYYTSTLSGINQVFPNDSEARGAIKVDLIGNQMTLTGSIEGLGDSMADIRPGIFIGNPGREGLIYDLPTTKILNDSVRTFEAADNTFILDNEQLTNLKSGQFFINVLTDNRPFGDIRGQILCEPNFAPDGDIRFLLPLDGEVISTEGDPTNPFATRWEQPSDKNKLYYILESSEFIDFRTIDDVETLHDVDSTFTFQLGALDTFLLDKGLEIGDTIRRYYRFKASDGSLQTTGIGNFATIIRGSVERVLGADLEISITAPNDEPYQIFSEIPYTITLVNNGPQTAEDVFVSAPIPDGMAFTSAEANVGMYNTFFRWWQIPALPAGDTAILDLTLFTLVENEPIENFVQVIGTSRLDPDSTPDNGEAPNPREDDEAVITLMTDGQVGMAGDTSDLELTIQVLTDEFFVFNNVTYIFQVTNNGPDTASNINISALIPEGLAFTGANASAGQFRVSNQDWVIPTLASGEAAELELILFTLVEGRPLTLFSQIIESDQFDPDSEVSNDLDNVPDEDDEAAVTILPRRGIQGGDVADLELNMSIDRMDYEVFSNYTYTLTVTNNGPDPASRIVVSAQLPDSLAYTSHAASIGDWLVVAQNWLIPYIESGETQTLKLVLFTNARTTPIPYFAQIVGVEQSDPDSEPNNNISGLPTEDDEALITLTPMPGNNFEGVPISGLSKAKANVFPVPANDFVQFNLNSDQTLNTTLSIVNASGVLLFQEKVSVQKGTNNFAFDIEQLTSGTYFIIVADGQSERQWSFVK